VLCCGRDVWRGRSMRANIWDGSGPGFEQITIDPTRTCSVDDARESFKGLGINLDRCAPLDFPSSSRAVSSCVYFRSNRWRPVGSPAGNGGGSGAAPPIWRRTRGRVKATSVISYDVTRSSSHADSIPRESARLRVRPMPARGEWASSCPVLLRGPF
jgi:hypothetical protein